MYSLRKVVQMRSFLYETKKTFIFQKGIFIVTSLLLFEFIYLVFTATPASYEMELYKDTYMQYLSVVSGPCSKEKEEYLEQVADEISYARKALPSLYQEYYSGSISLSDFQSQESVLSNALNSSSGFNALYEQYLYIRENTENRYFVYTNGWNALLCADSIDPILILGLLILIAPIYCHEYLSQMKGLIITQRYGSKSFSVEKIVLSNIIAIFFSSILFLEKLLYCSVRYGLPNANYPIQSLTYFGSYTGALSLMQGAIYSLCFQILGSIFLCSIILLCGSNLKHYAITCFIPFCSILLPAILFPDTIQYRLPLPLAFLRSSGFFRGTIVDEEQNITFRQIAINELCVIIICSLLAIAIFTYFVWVKSQNHVTRRHHLFAKKVSFSLLLLIILSGCTSYHSPQVSTVMNSRFSSEYTFSAYRVTIDSAEGNILFSKSDTSSTYLLRDPFLSTADLAPFLFGSGDNIYYMTITQLDEEGIRLSETTGESYACVWEISTIDGSQNLVFEECYQKNDKWSFLSDATAMFLHKNNIYFICQDSIRKVNCTTHHMTLLEIETSGNNFSFDGNNLYYLNTKYQLCVYNLSTSESFSYDNVVASDFILFEGGIYYIDLENKNSIYLFDPLTEEKEFISPGPARALTMSNGHIAYLNTQNLEVSLLH